MKNLIFNAVCLSVLATSALAVIDCSGTDTSVGPGAAGTATGVGGAVAGSGGAVGTGSGGGAGVGVGGASETGGAGGNDTGGSVAGAGGTPGTGTGGDTMGTGGASSGTGGAATGAGGMPTTGAGGAPTTGAGGSTGTGGNPNNAACPAPEPTVGSDCTPPPANAGPGANACRYTTNRGGAVDCTCRMNGARNDAGMRVDTWACAAVVVRPDAGAPPPPPVMDAGLRDTCPAAAIANDANCAAFVTGLMCPGVGGRECTCRAVGGGAVKLWNCAARTADAGGD